MSRRVRGCSEIASRWNMCGTWRYRVRIPTTQERGDDHQPSDQPPTRGQPSQPSEPPTRATRDEEDQRARRGTRRRGPEGRHADRGQRGEERGQRTEGRRTAGCCSVRRGALFFGWGGPAPDVKPRNTAHLARRPIRSSPYVFTLSIPPRYPARIKGGLRRPLKPSGPAYRPALTLRDYP